MEQFLASEWKKYTKIYVSEIEVAKSNLLEVNEFKSSFLSILLILDRSWTNTIDVRFLVMFWEET